MWTPTYIHRAQQVEALSYTCTRIAASLRFFHFIHVSSSIPILTICPLFHPPCESLSFHSLKQELVFARCVTCLLRSARSLLFCPTIPGPFCLSPFLLCLFSVMTSLLRRHLSISLLLPVSPVVLVLSLSHFSFYPLIPSQPLFALFLRFIISSRFILSSLFHAILIPHSPSLFLCLPSYFS